MNRSLVPSAEHRVLVTGSRGKSSLVRLIFAGLCACGLNARGRITGVVPRELLPGGSRRVARNGPGHVEEMRWWLRQIPGDVRAVVMENSAVHPDLQILASRWLRPSLTVWTNAREDHQEAWGIGREAATSALLRGIPDTGMLLLGAELSRNERLMASLSGRKGETVRSNGAPASYMASNRALAKAALECLGLLCAPAISAIDALEPDIADFRVFELPASGGARLASAFSANDPESTEHLFSLLGWTYETSSLLYSDRRDRGARRRSFEAFMRCPWRDRLILGGGERLDELTGWLRGKNVFGCGNVAGLPLALLEKCIEEECEWSIPGESVSPSR